MTRTDLVDALRALVVDTPPAGLTGDPITAIAYDSRRVVPGSVFVALKGLRADGGCRLRWRERGDAHPHRGRNVVARVRHQCAGAM